LCCVVGVGWWCVGCGVGGVCVVWWGGLCVGVVVVVWCVGWGCLWWVWGGGGGGGGGWGGGGVGGGGGVWVTVHVCVGEYVHETVNEAHVT